ncbi:MAG: SWIM zinc finger domain-containing protein [Firmicutes bacterium]|nr:SWIM zinc finger domain-containing protein [Bacillota bacterium]
MIYEDNSGVTFDNDLAVLRLFPDIKRKEVSFRAELKDPLCFRDCLLALKDCIKSKLYMNKREILEKMSDPLITITKDKVFFEAFSADESTYARITADSAFFNLSEKLSPGCTNIDFSAKLETGLMEIKSNSQVMLDVRREGISINRDGKKLNEVKINLPDSWMRGFLEIQSSMRLPFVKFELAVSDLRNIIMFMKGRKAAQSPRGMIFSLSRGSTPEVLIQPWNVKIKLRDSSYDGEGSHSIKIWGRRRLLLLEKILPQIKSVKAEFAGTGFPSFWTCDMGNIKFTLGLSPWTAREWTTDEAYHLFEAPEETGIQDLDLVLFNLEKANGLSVIELASETGFSRRKLQSVLNNLCVQGRTLFEPLENKYYPRDIFVKGPPSPPSISKRESDAEELVKNGKIRIIKPASMSINSDEDEELYLKAEFRVEGKSEQYETVCTVDKQGKIISGNCQCRFFSFMGFQYGPCKHILAGRRMLQIKGILKKDTE